MWFQVEVDPAELSLLLENQVNFAGGVLNDSQHPITYGTALDPILGNGKEHIIPEPSSLLLLGVALGSLLIGRKVHSRWRKG